MSFGLLGDTVMRTPIIHKIRSYFPEARIVVIVDPIGYEVYQNNPNVDEIIIMRRGKSSRLEYLKNKITIQWYLIKSRFDLIVDLYGGPSTYTMTCWSFAKIQIGFLKGKRWTNTSELKLLTNKTIETGNPYHYTNKLFQILAYFDDNIWNLDTTPQIFTSPITDQKIKQMVDSYDIKKPFLVSLGSSDLNKILDIKDNFLQIRMIYQEFGHIPLIVSNPGQEFLQERLISEFLKPNHIPYIQLPSLGIQEIMSLMKFIDFVIVPDTGLFHLAMGMKVPTFCIFTYTHPILVQPNQEKYGYYFEEGEGHDLHGLSRGKKEISINDFLETTKKFVLKLQNSKQEI